MKLKALLVLFTLISTSIFSQKIDRSLPESFRDHVSRKEYRKLLKYALYQLEGFEVLGVQEGTISIRLEEQPYQISMLPLVQQCVSLDYKQRKEFIREYINTLIHAYYDELVIASADFSTVKKYLSLRPYSEEAMSAADREHWVTRADREGTVTCVMLDLPSASITLEQEQLHHWGVSEEEIFRLARENCHTRTDEVPRQMPEATTELIRY